MNKLTFLVCSLCLFACSTTTTQTTQTKQTETTTTTKAPVIKTVTYDMSEAVEEDVTVHITLKAVDGKVTKAKVSSMHAAPELQQMNKEQQKAAIVVAKEHLKNEAPYNKVLGLKGTNVDVTFENGAIIGVLEIDFTVVDHKEFETAVGETPLVHVFGEGGKINTTEISLEAAEAILVLQKGKVLKVD